MIVGPPRDVSDPKIFHHVSLVAFLAWVGLGADGLSSSAYGPEEAYKALGPHSHLSIMLVAMTAVTIAVISIAYSNLIQHFPGGGGGYLVATKLLGSRVGVVSGCALLVDYVLTITVSIASGCDQLWSFLPPSVAHYKLLAEFLILFILIVLNLRGVKESVNILAPIFVLFIVTHAFAIVYAIGSHVTGLPKVFHDAHVDYSNSVSTIGFLPLMLILLRAYSLGGGTYTGIEAVSNGVSMLREPRVRTGKRTMALMAVSLAFTAGGIMFAYLLTNSMPAEGKTMNAVLLTNLFGRWHIGCLFRRHGLCDRLSRRGSRPALRCRAGRLSRRAARSRQHGPRLVDAASLQSALRPARHQERRLHDGARRRGRAAVHPRGHPHTRGHVLDQCVHHLFLTELGMARHWIKDRAKEPKWKSQLAIHGTGLVMCLSILVITTFEKFSQGGWVTVLITGVLIALCFAIRRHYDDVRDGLRRLDEILITLPQPESNAPIAPSELDTGMATAVISISSFSGFGLHQILSIHKAFPNYFKQFLFVSAAVVDSGNFKGAEELDRLQTSTEDNLMKYVRWAQAHGFRADYRMGLGTEAVETVEAICLDVAKEFPRAIFFTGRLIFKEEKWYHRLLHNETPHAIQRRLQFEGIQAMVLPIRVLE